MRVLVGCECSGIVRDAFTLLGHDAYSCDLQPSSGKHIQDNVLNVIDSGWDLLIAHPPCTYLSFVGNRHWNAQGREQQRKEAFDFFMALVNAPIDRVCIENPVGYPNQAYRKPDQIVHPYYFGDNELKRTCFWLKNLAPLWYWKTNLVAPEPRKTLSNAAKNAGKRIYYTNDIHDTKQRSQTFRGIANAMAKQWSNENEV